MYRVDPDRIGIPIDARTGIYDAAEYNGQTIVADIAQLDDTSLNAWCANGGFGEGAWVITHLLRCRRK